MTPFYELGHDLLHLVLALVWYEPYFQDARAFCPVSVVDSKVHIASIHCHLVNYVDSFSNAPTVTITKSTRSLIEIVPADVVNAGVYVPFGFWSLNLGT